MFFRLARILGVCTFLTGIAFAGTATSNMAVSATVIASCSIVAGPLSFTNYDPVVGSATSPLAGTATLTATCTNGSNATITLGQGSNPTGSSTDAAPARRLKESAGANYLTYSLFQDSARTVVWGNTAGTGKAITGTTLAQTITVYGQIDAAQNVPTGAYTDTIVATITF